MPGHVTNCRLCKSDNLEVYLDLGNHVPSDSFRVNKDAVQNVYPLQVCLCHNCGLSQLSYVVDPEELYSNDYPYESSTTEGGKRHYFEFAKSVVDKFKLGKEDLVVDIGSNVGVLLEGFKNNGTRILGVDPASNIAKIANDRGIETTNCFWSNLAAELIRCFYGSASVIVGTNVFAHVDDLNDFVRGIKNLLTNGGVFIFESPNLMSLVKENAYSSVYHEHLSYLSLKPLVKFFEDRGLEVFHVEERDIHEGSFRVFVARKGKRLVESSVQDYLAREIESGIHDIEVLKRFARKAEKHRIDLLLLLDDLKTQGKTVVALSAPAKGMTLLNYLDLDSDNIAFATEKSRLKIGRFCPGSDIEVLGDEALLEKKPDYALVLAWNFGKEIINNNKAFSEAGGKFIVPFPEIKVV